MVRFIRLLLNEKGRFLWSAHRITERQKAGKARSIKGKQLKNSRNTALKQLVELLSSQRDNQIYIAYQLRSFDFGVSFCADFGSSEQSSCGAAKNSPQDCFLNAATVLKEIIKFILLISSEVSTSEFLFTTNFVGRILFTRHNQILCLYIFNLA